MATFEDDLKKLEEINKKLQSGEAGIEKSMALYESGVKLADELSAKLEKYQSRIEILDTEEKES